MSFTTKIPGIKFASELNLEGHAGLDSYSKGFTNRILTQWDLIKNVSFQTQNFMLKGTSNVVVVRSMQIPSQYVSFQPCCMLHIFMHFRLGTTVAFSTKQHPAPHEPWCDPLGKRNFRCAGIVLYYVRFAGNAEEILPRSPTPRPPPNPV